MSDVLEVLRDTLGDADLTDGHSQGIHQADGIVIGTVSGTEARHGDADDTFSVHAELVESLHTNQQGQRRIQAPTHADDYRFGMSVDDAACQTHDLNGEDLIARPLHVIALWDEGMRIDATLQHEIVMVDNIGIDKTDVLVNHPALSIGKRRVHPSFRPQVFHIYLRRLQLRLQGEALTLGQQFAIFIDQRVAAIDHVLRALTKARAAIYITAHGACALIAEQAEQVVVLANELIAGTEIEDDVGPGQGKMVARRCRCPHVLTDLDAKGHAVHRTEELWQGGDGDRMARIVERAGTQILSRSKPALLVELTVIGQVGLRHNTEHMAFLNDDGTIEQQITDGHGGSDDGDDVELVGELKEFHDRHLGSIEQHMLAEEILTSVASEAKLREDDDLHALPFGLRDEVLDVLDVFIAVGDTDKRHCRSHLDISVFHFAYV